MNTGPDFICIGAEKAGTTWLYDNIRHHPDVWLPPKPFKELHYFDDKTPNKHLLHIGKFNHGNLLRKCSPLLHNPSIETLRWVWRFNYHRNDSMHWYRSLFTRPDKICGDITPSYSTMDTHGVEYARRVVGDKCKVILIIRNPVEQSWSSVKMLYRYRNIDIRQCDASEIVDEIRLPFMALKSDYSRMIKLWETHFDEDMFKVFFFDDLINDSESFLLDICKFIGINVSEWRPSNPEQATNRDKAEIVIPDDINLKLSSYFLDELETLSSTLGGHATTWLNKAQNTIGTTNSEINRAAN